MELKLNSHLIPISNPDKLLFKKAGITKKQYVLYYERIAPIMIPHTRDRLLSMYRFPDGVINNHVDGFYQKDAGKYFPDWMKRVPVRKEDGGTVQHVMLNNAASLVCMANLVCVPHVWLSRDDKLDYPDRMIFDLDPAGKANFKLVKWAAQQIRTCLEDELDLPTFVMTTGSRGLHIVTPLKRTQPFDTVRSVARDIAQLLVDRHPNKLTVEMRKAQRGNRIFLDYLRNGFGATGVAPYAVRAKVTAPIATPITWNEATTITTPQKYTLKNIFRRLARKEDPWKSINKQAVSLKKAAKAIAKLLSK